jgi:transposase
MSQPNDLSRCLVSLEQETTLVAVIELSQSSWLIVGTVPGIERQPLKKIVPDEATLLRLLHRWRDEAIGKGRTITRIAVAYEAGRDGFWLARWLAKQGIEVHVIHSSSVAVSREHRRAKTDRLDTAMLTRVFLGWLRRAWPLLNGIGPYSRARGCQTARPGAGNPDCRAHAHH